MIRVKAEAERLSVCGKQGRLENLPDEYGRWNPSGGCIRVPCSVRGFHGSHGGGGRHLGPTWGTLEGAPKIKERIVNGRVSIILCGRSYARNVRIPDFGFRSIRQVNYYERGRTAQAILGDPR